MFRLANAQSSLSISAPTIWSNIKVKDNWTPPTAPHYKKYRGGSAFGYGVNLNYSFQPKFIIKDKHFSINVGAGYFKQRFDIRRPFNYNSGIYIIYRTDNYSYHCWQWAGGLTYSYPINKYALTANVSYSQLYSFRQEYSPTSGDPGQVNKHKIDFAKMLSFSLGIQRNIGNEISIEVNVLLPYSRWRNDEIFDDDPLTFSKPTFSIGTSISIAYHFKKKNQL